MSVRATSRVSRAIVVAAVLLLAVVTAPRPGQAATGDILQTVTLVGTAADCGSAEGTSVALVQGSKVGFPDFPVLLVTTCLSSGGSASAKDKRASLYFLDSGSGNVVKTIKTTVGNATTAPGSGWAQLVLAPDKGVLLGCATEGSLYTIDFNALNLTPDGTTLFVKKPAAACGGLAWDPSNNSIYQASGSTIFHFDFAGNALPNPPNPASFSAPSGCVVSGLSVVGGVLLVTCDGSATVHRRDKTTGAQLPTGYPAFASNTFDDLECDPATFAGNIEAVWSKKAAAEQVQAFRVPAGTCGLPPTATVMEPAKCPVDAKYWTTGNPATGAPVDTDGDGLWDCWEELGVDFDGDGNIDLSLSANVDTNGDGVADAVESADPNVKDIFVEIDYMQDPGGSRSHKPDPLALLAVRNAFANAPGPPVSPGPGPVRLHFLVDERMDHVASLAFEPCTIAATGSAVDFDALKATFFGTAAERNQPNADNILNAKRFAYRYMIFAHNLLGTNASGCAEVVGDDTAISMAGFGQADASLPPSDPNFGHKIHTTDQEAGTVMHEIGHLLGLRHGGPDNVGCKPNYLSVMNYSFQFSDFVTVRPLDFSREELATLNELELNESDGIGDVAAFALDGRRTVYSGPTSSVVWTLQQQAPAGSCPSAPAGEDIVSGGPIDWNCAVGGGAVAANINRHVAAGCDGEGSLLVGSNDWLNLEFNARASLDFAGGIQEFGDKKAEHEDASYKGADRDGDEVADGVACDPSVGPGTPPPSAVACAIDVKPGTNPKVLSKGNEANVRVAILGNATFDPATQVIRETLRLNGILVKLNNQGQGTCQVDKNGPFDNLVCQFLSVNLPLGLSHAQLEGQACINGVVDDGVCGDGGVVRAFRARDLIQVVH